MRLGACGKDDRVVSLKVVANCKLESARQRCFGGRRNVADRLPPANPLRCRLSVKPQELRQSMMQLGKRLGGEHQLVI